LQNDEGIILSRHEEKAQLLCEVYKDRLGETEFTHMYFDLHSLLNASDDLHSLEDPFLKEGIDENVANLPSDKFLGPDGFNEDFLRKCWSMIAQEFYELCKGFYEGNIYMQSVNGSHIVLVPKKDNAVKVGDFRPISLLNPSKLKYKIVDKATSKQIPTSHH
jgi:hypothetical protein